MTQEANEAELTVGDVVRLRSGSPDMTLEAILPEGAVRCAFVRPTDGELLRNTFISATLKLIKPRVEASGRFVWASER